MHKWIWIRILFMQTWVWVQICILVRYLLIRSDVRLPWDWNSNSATWFLASDIKFKIFICINEFEFESYLCKHEFDVKFASESVYTNKKWRLVTMRLILEFGSMVNLFPIIQCRIFICINEFEFEFYLCKLEFDYKFVSESVLY